MIVSKKDDVHKKNRLIKVGFLKSEIEKQT